MQVTLCNACGKQISDGEEEGEAGASYWYTKPVNTGGAYCPPRPGYRHVALCSRPCFLRWVQEQVGDPEDALSAPLDD